MSNIEIQRASADLVDLIAPLFDQYRGFYGQAADPDGARRFIEQRLSGEESVVLLAQFDGRPAGFTQLYPSFSSVSMAAIWVLNDLYVASDCRQSGVGRALMEAAAEFAKQDGAKRLSLATAPDNTVAQQLYESLGWKRDSFWHYELELS